MKEKGFTLIELLAVIVILAIIALIAVPIVLNIINEARDSANLRSVENYATAAKNAVLTYQMVHPTDNITECTVQEDGNLGCVGIETPIEVSVDGTKLVGGLFNFNDYGNVTGSYLQLESLPGTKFKYYQGGTSVQLPACEFADGTYGAEGKVGAKYHCDVNDDGLKESDPYFYLLNESAPYNLIMEKNFEDEKIPVTISWCIEGNNNSTCKNINDTSKGSYLYHIKQLWKNLGISKIAFPTYEQIYNLNSNVLLSSTPWLYGSLYSSVVPYGYWLASAHSTSTLAYYVEGSASIVSANVNISGNYGVRPVISILSFD